MNYISTIAKYEAKTLSRSWFFRIFAILSILLISIANLALFSPIGANQWSMRGISSFIPHANLLYFNLFQSVIAIFISSDFMKRDKNQDTAQVFYIRPMSNMEYVLGKLLGVLKVFVFFNFIIIGVSMIFNVIADGVGVNLLAYIYFLLLINIPSLVFILGFSFFLMSLIKNQAITYLVLLGYVGGSLFGFGDKAGQVLDYMAFYLPMSFSDIIGFSNLDKILLQRGSFLFLGMFFTALSVLMLNRLPQSKFHRILTYVLGFVALCVSIGAIGGQLYKYYDDINRREEAINLNNAYFKYPLFEVNAYDIDLKHQDNELEVTTVMQGHVSADSNDTISFALNEGLKINSLSINDKEVKYKRQNHLVLIPAKYFDSRRTQIKISYKGEIDQTLCYLDVDDYREERMVGLIRVPQTYAVVDPDFLLLTTECLWYPLAGVTHTTLSPAWESFNFSQFNLKVKTEDSLVVVSQGKERLLEDGTYHFSTQQPMARISVTAGHFEKCTMMIDDVLPVNLYIKPGHDYFSSILDSITDTIPALTEELLNDFESNVGLYYPYSSFNLVEVPVQFTAHTHLWAQTTDYTQPMVTLLPEKGAGLQPLDFKSNMRWIRFGGNTSEMTEEEKQILSFNSFFQQTFLNTSTRVNAINIRDSYSGSISSAYSIYPNYHYFSNHIASKEYALLNVVMESYYYDMFSNGRESMRSVFEGSTEANKAAKILQTMSFKDFLQCDSLEELFSEAISMKGKYLFSLLESKELDIELDDALDEFLGNTERTLASFDYFSEVMMEDLVVNFEEVWNTWIIDKGIPSFVASDPEYYRFHDVDANCYQVIWKVSNISETNGVVTFTFRSRRGGGRGPGMMSNEETENVKVLIPAGQTLEMAKVFDNQPGMMTLDFNVSKNLPTTQMYFARDYKEQENATGKNYQHFSDGSISTTDEGEIVVDNEDKGFELTNQIRGGLIKNWIDRDDEEVTYQQGHWGEMAATKWIPYVDTRYYGTSIKSAYLVEGGNGGQKAEWKTMLDSSAYYSVYAYVGNNTQQRRLGPPGAGGQNQQQDKDRMWQYFVVHEGDTEEALLNLSDAETGWNLIGLYYFDKADTARVILTNESKESRVIADAIKWVLE